MEKIVYVVAKGKNSKNLLQFSIVMLLTLHDLDKRMHSIPSKFFATELYTTFNPYFSYYLQFWCVLSGVFCFVLGVTLLRVVSLYLLLPCG